MRFQLQVVVQYYWDKHEVDRMTPCGDMAI